jgi:hypothetical protein
VNKDVATFIEKWGQTGVSERANFQPFCGGLCDLLGLPRPDGQKPNESENAYVFEKNVPLHQPGGGTTTGRIDLYKRDHFVMEGKQGADEGAVRKGHGTRGSVGWDKALVRAKKQAENYIHALPASEGRPPFLIVVDVGHSIELYSEFSCTGGIYVPYPDPRSHRIYLRDLEKESVRETLRTIWTDPLSLDPARRSARVTREIADKLARLAKSLEASGHAPAASGGFLMRCIFTMFAEDVKLIPHGSFEALLRSIRDQPAQFVPLVKSVWDSMNNGGFCVALRDTLLKFNGGLFEERNPLPVTSEQIDLLIEAAHADWREVEPAIFGTLLERALDPRERNKLGAHYTPRDYVERLVMPTVIEPLREQWDNVQAAVARHLQDDNEKRGQREAIKELQTFLDHLCTLKILDPACGSGNFLYVTMEHMKRLEGEVLDLLLALGQERLELEGHSVHPSQFLGIELNPRAAVLAELCLWIGYLQWHFRTRGAVNPPEPVISKFHTIECRDAVLAYDAAEPIIVAAASSRSTDAKAAVAAASTRLSSSQASRSELRESTERQDAAPTSDYSFFNPYKKIEITKAHLPHWRQEGVTYFITFRLADSLPKAKLEQWKTEREAWLTQNPPPHDEAQKSEYFERFSARMEALAGCGSWRLHSRRKVLRQYCRQRTEIFRR